MIRLFSDLGFILRNWRYLHAHHALWAELRDWCVDYDPPTPPKGPYMDYSIKWDGTRHAGRGVTT